MSVRRSGAAAALLVAVVMLSGCGTSLSALLGGASRDETGQIDARGDLDVFTIAPGDCFFDDALAGLSVNEQSETSSVAAVPCAEEHTFEAYHEFTLPEGEYPGAEVVEEKAYGECEQAFAEFIKVPYEESVYEYSFYSPSSETWEYQDDRLVSCVVSTAEYDRLTGSLKGVGE